MDEMRFTRAFKPCLVMEAESEQTVRQAKRPKFIPGCSKGIKAHHGEDFRRPAPKGLFRCKYCHHLTSNRGKICCWCMDEVERPSGVSLRLSRVARGS